MTQQPHQPRCVTEWRRLVQPRPILPWSTLWASKVGNKVKDFIWRLAHRVLPTKAYLRQWGMAVNLNCPFCSYREDIYQALVHCQRAQRVWRELQPTLKAVAGHQLQINLEALVFRRGLPTTQPAEELCFYILATTAEMLWKTRNKRTFDPQVNTGNVAKDVVHVIKRHIRTDFYINPIRVEQFWGYRSILVQIVDGRLLFNI